MPCPRWWLNSRGWVRFRDSLALSVCYDRTAFRISTEKDVLYENALRQFSQMHERACDLRAGITATLIRVVSHALVISIA